MEIKGEKELKQTVSAGGVVRKIVDKEVHIVLVRDSERHDWFLPKGHIESGETIEEAAIREVKEETGLDNIKIVKKLGITQRKAFEGNEWKTIHYFLFDTNDNKQLVEVKDDGKVLTPRWFPIDNLPKLFWQKQEELIKENFEIIKI